MYCKKVIRKKNKTQCVNVFWTGNTQPDKQTKKSWSNFLDDELHMIQISQQ